MATSVLTTKFLTTEQGQASSRWWVIDAANIPVGRLASAAAILIRGKHKPTYTPHVSCGDFVVVINADKVVLTGDKSRTKYYRHHTGYIGGLKEVPGGKMLATKPKVVIERAVNGMLPSGILGHRMAKKLKVYTGSDHPHTAQTPEIFTVKVKKKK